MNLLESERSTRERRVAENKYYAELWIILTIPSTRLSKVLAVIALAKAFSLK